MPDSHINLQYTKEASCKGTSIEAQKDMEPKATNRFNLTLIKMPVPSRLESGLVSGCPKAVTAWMPLEKGPVSRASVIPVPPLASVLVSGVQLYRGSPIGFCRRWRLSSAPLFHSYS